MRRLECDQTARLQAPPHQKGHAMKRTSIVLSAALLIASLRLLGAADSLSEALQKGLLEEESNHNLDAAIQAYQSTVSHFDDQRKIAATALFRLGECYRKQGKTNEAAAQYQRVLQEFPDQDSLIGLSQRVLATLGRSNNPAEGAERENTAQTVTDPEQLELLKREIKLAEQEVNIAKRNAENGRVGFADLDKSRKALLALQRQLPENASSAAQKNLVEQQIKLVEQLLAEQKKKIEAGAIAPGDEIPLQRELIGLQRELIMVSKAPAIARGPSKTESPLATDEETREIQRLKAVIRNSPDLVNARTGFGYTPLHLAALKGESMVAEFLLSHGAEVDAKTPEGNTPLHFAALAGHKAVAELLLSRGADVNGRNAFGATPLHLAAAKGFKAEAESLLAHHADLNAVCNSGRVRAENSPQVWDVFVAAGAPIHSAVRYGGLPMLEWLLSHKPDLNAGRDSAGTLLQAAVQTGSFEVAKRLMLAGLDINEPAGDGSTPLHTVVAWGRPEMIKWLLANGAEVSAADNHKQTALHKLVAGFNEEVAELLLKHKADINAKDDAGATPLHYAAEAGKVPAVRWLLTKGAVTDIKDEEGYTPEARARRGQKHVRSDDGVTFYAPMPANQEIQRMLQNRGAKFE